MKNLRYSAIAYERPGPLSDMFVPRHILMSSSPIVATRRHAPKFLIAFLLLVTMPALMYQGSTLSYFNDTEVSTGNTFAAAPLDFTVSPDHSSATLIAGQTGETFIITVAPIAGSLPFQYKIAGATSGNAAFCSAITASGSAPLPFSGPASSISTGSTASLSPWSLTLTLPSGAPGVVDGQMCILDLTYQGYQDGGAVGTEYHDTEHVILTLTADPPIVMPSATPSALQISQTSTDQPAADTVTTTDATTTEELTPPTDPPLDLLQAPSDSATSTGEDSVVTPPTIPDPVGDSTTTDTTAIDTVTPPADTPPPPPDVSEDSVTTSSDDSVVAPTYPPPDVVPPPALDPAPDQTPSE